MFPFRKNTDDEPVAKNQLELKKPRKPRKKKEIQKPWGREERLAILAVLVILPILSIFFFIRSNNSNLSPRVLGDIASHSVDVNTLKTALTNEIQSQQGTYGIWVQAVDDTYKLGINEDEQFDGASLFKLPLMIAYYQEVDQGKINPNASYILKYSDQAAGAGILSNMPVGTILSYHDIVQAMGKNSDNSAFQIMGGILGFNKITDVIKEIGMTNTNFTNSITTPADMGLLFYKLTNSNLLSNSSRNELSSFLVNTDFENLIPASTPDNTKVVHKYGSDNGELNDAGIVYTNRPYIIVILAKDINPNIASQEITKIAKIVYDWSTK